MLSVFWSCLQIAETANMPVPLVWSLDLHETSHCDGAWTQLKRLPRGKLSLSYGTSHDFAGTKLIMEMANGNNGKDIRF